MLVRLLAASTESGNSRELKSAFIGTWYDGFVDVPGPADLYRAQRFFVYRRPTAVWLNPPTKPPSRGSLHLIETGLAPKFH